MRIPARRIEITRTHDGKESENGWLVIDIKGMDLEGITKLYVDLDDVGALGQRRTAAKSRLASLFGGEDEDDLLKPPSDWDLDD